MQTPQRQQGFTLIELIIVIVILGILAAVAVPKFVDLSDEAEEAQLSATASALASGSAINYAACALNGHDSDDIDKCTEVENCNDVANLVSNPSDFGDDDNQFSIDDEDIENNGDEVTCELTQNSTEYTAEFIAIGAGQ